MPQSVQKRPLFSTATANQARPLPKFQSTKMGPSNANKYVADLDPLLKLNKGGFTAVGADASSNRPYALAGAEPIPVSAPADQQPFATPYNQGGDTNPFQVEPLPNNPFNGQQQDTNPSADQFMQHLDEVLQGQGYGTPEAPQKPYGGANGLAQMQDGGVLFDDGKVRYEDGSEREYKDPGAQLIPASFPDGLQHYTDGSVRKPAAEPGRGIASMPGNQVLYSDDTMHYGPYLMGEGGVNTPGGTRGLISGVFGQDRPITQQYGNINPIEPTRGHVNTGTDIRTADLKGSSRDFKLPVGAKVLQVYHDDGTRFGDKSGHLGYGNSLLLELPSGERLRFSHLSKILDVQAGDEIKPGEVFGQPGTTGNTYGEHLDLEYYNPQGKIDNPANFSGFTNPRSILPNQPEPGSLVPGSSRQPNQSTQPSQGQQTQSLFSSQPTKSSYFQGPINQGVQKAASAVKQALPSQDQQRTAIEGLGTALGAPELQTGELSKSQGTDPFRQLAGNLVDVASTPLKKIGVPDLGISEMIAGGKTVNTGANLAPQSYAYDASGNPIASKAPTAQDYAGTLGKNISAVGDQVKTTFSNAVEKPIEGINKLKTDFQSGVADLGKGLNDTLSNIGGKRKVGEESGGDQNIIGAPSPTFEQNDIRDPFFKLGGAQTYGSFINKGAVGDGGLSLDLFKPDFYKDANNVANVFGSTYLLPKAQDKYKANEAAKYPKMGHMGYAEGYDNGAIDDYNKEIDKYNSGIDSYINGINLKTKNPTYGQAPSPSQAIMPGTNFSPNVSVTEQRANANPSLFSGAFSLAPFDLNAPATAGGSASISPTALNMSSMRLNTPATPSRNSTPSNANYSSPSGPAYSPAPKPAAVSQPSRSPVASYNPPAPARSPVASYNPPAPARSPVASYNPPAPARSPVASYNPPKPSPVASYQPSKPAQSSSKGNTNIFTQAVNAVKRLFGF